MANSILTPTAVTREAAMLLENSLSFAKLVDRQYDDSFGDRGAATGKLDNGKFGTTLKVRLPNRFTVRSGATLSAQDLAETSVDLVCATQYGVDVNFTSAELTLTIDEFSDRVLRPAMSQLANQIDQDGCALYANVANLVGTAGTTPATALVLLQGGQKLSEGGVPQDQRYCVVNPAANAALVNGMTGFFHAGANIKDQFVKGAMGADTLGYDLITMDQNVASHTVGPLGGTPLVNGASQTGSSLVTDGWTAAAASRLAAGDVFTIAGVYKVNPQNRASTGALQQFVVTAAFSSDAGGAGTISISPPITTSGAYQTVNASPADNAALTIVGSASTAYPQNLAFHKEAFALVTADLIMPNGVHFAARKRYKGVSMRCVAQYDITNDKFPCRFDVLIGWKTIDANKACRIIG